MRPQAPSICLSLVCSFFVLRLSAAAQPGGENAAEDPETALEEIVTVSSRIDRPLRTIGTAVSVITGDEIEARGYATVVDALRTEPGIAASNAGGLGKVSSLRIRGEEGYRTLIRIDGIDVSDPSGTQMAPSVEHLLTTREIERIEVLRGPQGFIYGADAGGVVNISSRAAPDTFSGIVGLEIGDYGNERVDLNLSNAGERGDFVVSVTDLQSDGFNSQIADSVLADDDGYENTTAHLRLGWNATESLRVEAVVRDVDARFEFDQCGFPTTHDCTGDTRQTTARVAADWHRDGFAHTFAFSEADTDRRNFADGFEVFTTRGSLGRFEYTGSFAPSTRTTWVYGIDIVDAEVSLIDGTRMDRRQDAAYFELHRQIGARLYITVGSRHDQSDDFGGHTSSRASFVYVSELGTGASIKYRTSYGTGFRAPSLSEIAYNAGPFAFAPAAGLGLTEEQSRGFDAGIEIETPGGAHFEATWFDQSIDDEIYFDLGTFSGYLQIPGRSNSRGVELAADIPLGRRWDVSGNVLLSDTRAIDGSERIRRPDSIANLGFRYRGAAERLSLGSNLRIVSDAVDEVFGIGRVPLESYELLDLSARFSFNESLEIFGRVENLLDEDYREVVGFRTSGRAAYAGVRVSF